MLAVLPSQGTTSGFQEPSQEILIGIKAIAVAARLSCAFVPLLWVPQVTGGCLVQETLLVSAMEQLQVALGRFPWLARAPPEAGTPSRGAWGGDSGEQLLLRAGHRSGLGAEPGWLRN